MNPAQTTQTGATAQQSDSPFDQIALLEEQEAKRVETELEHMEREKQEVLQAIQQKEEQAEQEMKEKAREELKEFRNDEPAQILKGARGEAAKECDAIEQSYEQRAADVTAALVSRVTDADSLSSLAA